MQKVSDHKIAAAYAEAWFSAAKEKDTEEIAFQEAKALQKGIGDISGLWAELSVSQDDEHYKTDMISSFTKKVNLSEVSAEVLKLLAQNGRLKLIGLVLGEYIRLYYQDKGIIEVHAESAVALTAAQKQKLKKVLEKKLSASVIIDHQVNPDVLGGLAVKFGSFLIDDTIRHKLEQMEKLLAQQKA